ncbi:MAG: ribosome maturation factor RimM [Desulfovibrionales bacterium]
MGKPQYLTIGRVAKAFGLKGELIIDSYAGSPLLFAELPRIYARDMAGRIARFRIAGFRMHSGRVVLKLEGVQGRDAAESLRGRDLLVRYRDLPPRGEGEVYLFELLECEVLLTDGTTLGRIHDVQAHSGQEYWTIRDDQDREILFPVAEPFVHKIDLGKKQVVVSPPPGLVELYLEEAARSAGSGEDRNRK